ncbi:MAG: septal ring lytic transglycosylase RlpA family protein [Brevinematia bacterium]
MRKLVYFVFFLILLFVPFLNAQEEYLYGYVSYYSQEFGGKKTASGVIFDPQKYTCASRTLPFGTVLEVMNVKNGKSVVVMVNDRGPFVEGRLIDLSEKAAEDLDFKKDGLAFCRIRIVRFGSGVFSEDEYKKMIGEFGSFDTKKAYEFSVQVGAFTNRILAERMLDKLKKDGFNNSYITEKVVGKVIFNRVRVGDYGSKEEALRVRDVLTQRGYDTYFVSTYVEK